MRLQRDAFACPLLLRGTEMCVWAAMSEEIQVQGHFSSSSFLIGCQDSCESCKSYQFTAPHLSNTWTAEIDLSPGLRFLP